MQNCTGNWPMYVKTLEKTANKQKSAKPMLQREVQRACYNAVHCGSNVVQRGFNAGGCYRDPVTSLKPFCLIRLLSLSVTSSTSVPKPNVAFSILSHACNTHRSDCTIHCINAYVHACLHVLLVSFIWLDERNDTGSSNRSTSTSSTTSAIVLLVILYYSRYC
jgi:hypothetical protein